MTTTPNNNEQWLLDGICRECRRKGYCSKPCKRNQVRTEREVTTYIREKTGLDKVLDVLRVKGR